MQRQKTKMRYFLIVSFVVPALFGFTLVHGQPAFKDVTAESGIHHQFIVFEGMFGGGACVLDLNNDGLEDLYITGGMNDDVLYLNTGNGTFQNIFKNSALFKFFKKKIKTHTISIRDRWFVTKFQSNCRPIDKKKKERKNILKGMRVRSSHFMDSV